MPKHFGLRAKTRHLFAKDFRQNGPVPLSKYLITYRRGDFVDIKADGGVTKGMPQKFYHGRTGRVFTVNKRALGVIVNKQVGNKILPKRIYVRIEHVRLSRCSEEFKNRVKQFDALKKEAKQKGEQVRYIKRMPQTPKDSQVIKNENLKIEELGQPMHTEAF